MWSSLDLSRPGPVYPVCPRSSIFRVLNLLEEKNHDSACGRFQQFTHKIIGAELVSVSGLEAVIPSTWKFRQIAKVDMDPKLREQIK